MISMTLVDCQFGGPPVSQFAHQLKSEERRLDRQQKLHAQYVSEYREKYRAYRCERNELPITQAFDVDLQNPGILRLSPQLHLRVLLGRMLHTEDGNTTRLRTETRYVLLTASGRKLGEGEGKITRGDDGQPTEGTVEMRLTPATLCVEACESLPGVGDIRRHVIFMPATGSPLDATGIPQLWQVYHVDDLPRRQRIAVGGETGVSHGVSNGKIYIEMDGLFYAFPVEEFSSSSLEFSLG